MEIVTSTQDHQNYLDDLSKGKFHLVTFAEDGSSNLAAALEFSFNIKRRDITIYCDQINQAEETGTLWPIAKVSAIPKKFGREPLDKPQDLHHCIRDAFVANRDYCKSRRMLFDFTSDVLNAQALEDEIHQFAMGEFNCRPLEKVEVWFDRDPAVFGIWGLY